MGNQAKRKEAETGEEHVENSKSSAVGRKGHTGESVLFAGTDS